jgi:surface carbohydrate biosynthesis protein (TIGR04326 family)
MKHTHDCGSWSLKVETDEKKYTAYSLSRISEQGLDVVLSHSIVDMYACSVRDKVIAQIASFANTNIDGQTIRSYLKLDHSFSCWWLTSLSEKSLIGKTPELKQLLGVFALESFMDEQGHATLELEETIDDEFCRMIAEIAKGKKWSLRKVVSNDRQPRRQPLIL